MKMPVFTTGAIPAAKNREASCHQTGQVARCGAFNHTKSQGDDGLLGEEHKASRVISGNHGNANQKAEESPQKGGT